MKNFFLIFFLFFIASFISFEKLNANLAYVTNEKDNTVSVIDIKKKKVIKTVKVGQRPRGIILSKDEKLVLICASDDDRQGQKATYFPPSTEQL